MVAEALTAEEWQVLVDAKPTPIECVRCGRWLTSISSIERRLGPTCALLQALEAVSHTSTPKTRQPQHQLIAFRPAGGGWFEIVDTNDVVVGRLEKTAKGTSWAIYVFGQLVDLDSNFENAKRRAERIFVALWS